MGGAKRFAFRTIEFPITSNLHPFEHLCNFAKTNCGTRVAVDQIVDLEKRREKRVSLVSAVGVIWSMITYRIRNLERTIGKAVDESRTLRAPHQRRSLSRYADASTPSFTPSGQGQASAIAWYVKLRSASPFDW